MWLKIQDKVREWRDPVYPRPCFWIITTEYFPLMDYGPAGDQNRKPEMTQTRVSSAILIGPYDFYEDCHWLIETCFYF